VGTLRSPPLADTCFLEGISMERIETDLQSLANPAHHVDPLDLQNTAADRLQSYLRSMLTIRLAEEAIAELVISREAVCPCHLGIGQEAIAVGVSANLNAADRVFGGHRSHSHYLALGGDLNGLFAEVLGKETGCSRGMGGSMHLYGPDVGFHGSVPIVAATIPIAVGAALAIQMDGNPQVAVSYFGDGAAEEGVLHESLNLAAVKKLPVLFVCENNLYASHLDILLRQPSDRVARFAEAHRVPLRVVDGNDVIMVAAAARKLIALAREGQGPGFLEAVTYRWRGHVGADENIDVGVRRKLEDLQAWKHRDPIGRLRDAMTARGVLSPGAMKEMETGVRTAIDKALEAARAAPYPPAEALLDRVFASNFRKVR
jgi:pyruvate dehydrogenase E1 component alpha subunit